MTNPNTNLKIAAGYAMLIGVIMLSAWLVYDNTHTIIDLDRKADEMTLRRDAADSLVHNLLEVNNSERALCLGLASERTRFDNALDRTRQSAYRLRTLLDEPRQRQRVDSLTLLLDSKRSNMAAMLKAMGRDRPDEYYRSKVRDLHSGRDSVIIHPEVKAAGEDHETVYEVVKTRKTFFGRLADAFRGQRSDTVSTTRRTGRHNAETTRRAIDIADTVADVLAEIKRREGIDRLAARRSLNAGGRRLEMVSMELAERTRRIVEDIRRDERLTLRAAVDSELGARRSVIIKIVALACVAVLSALVLGLYIRRDIRRTRRYSRTLERAKAETERVMEQRERLLLTITHDIKAPAASISGFTQLLEEHIADDKGRSLLDGIRTSATHLLSLVSRLLDYHSLERGKADTNPVSFSPLRLVVSSVDERRHEAAAKGIALKCDTSRCPDGICRADAFRIKQILDNIIGNALKYTARGEVTVNAALDDGRLTLTVSDTGCGMTPDEQRRVFNAFTRLPEAQGVEGAGLGLSITREAVKLLGGSLNLKSAKGRGSVFTVCLPVDRSPVPADRQTANADTDKPRHRPAPTTGADSRLKILILDDDRLQLKLLGEMLARLGEAGFIVRSTDRVAEAIAAATDFKPDIMLIDLEMPEMSGTDVIARLDLTAIKAVAMTAHRPDIAPRLTAAGFSACLFKPFTLTDLADTISLLSDRSIVAADIHQRSDTDTNINQQAGGTIVAADVYRQTSSPSSDRFAPLTAFADGDPEAERQILAEFAKSIAECRSALTAAINPQPTSPSATPAPPDRKSISSIAHRLLPTVSMVSPHTAEILQTLTSTPIAELDDNEVRRRCETVNNNLFLIHNSFF